MCTPTQGAILPYGLKIPSSYFPFGPNGGFTQAHLSALDFQRSQLNDYNVRVQLGLRNYQNSLGISPFHAYITDPYAQAYFYKHDPRARFVQEEPKPSHSYIGLIGMAILNSKDKKLVLSDIYQWILDNYPYFRTRGPGWRNSIRHNLSLNDCFIKSGRSANGKGHYWAVHPANIDDFERGDFRRRRAQRKVRRHMGLSVPDDDDSPSPSPTQPWTHHDLGSDQDRCPTDPTAAAQSNNSLISGTPGLSDTRIVHLQSTPIYAPVAARARRPSKRRLFDMASILAPDDDEEVMDTEINSVKTEQATTASTESRTNLSGFIFHPIPDSKAEETEHGGPHSTEESTSIVGTDSSSAQRELAGEHICMSRYKRKEMHDDSDDEGDDDQDDDNDEIRVTSGETSPVKILASPCSKDEIFQIEGNKENGNANDIRNDMTENGQDVGSSGNFNSVNSMRVKSENALDLSSSSISSSTASDVEAKLNCVKVKLELECGDKSASPDVQTSQGAGIRGEPGLTKDLHSDRSNIDSRSLENTHFGNNYIPHSCEQKEGESSQENFLERGPRLNRNFLVDRFDLPPNSREHHLSKFSSDSSRFLQPDHEGPVHFMRNSDSKYGLDRAHTEHLGTGHPTMEGLSRVTESSTTSMPTISNIDHMVADSLRRPNGAVRWADMPGTFISRERMSAFSSLGVRAHTGIFAPQFQTGLARNFPLPPAQRLLLPTTVTSRPSTMTSSGLMRAQVSTALPGTKRQDSVTRSNPD